MQNLTSTIEKLDIYHGKIWHLPLQNLTSTIAKSDIYHCKIKIIFADLINDKIYKRRSDTPKILECGAASILKLRIFVKKLKLNIVCQEFNQIACHCSLKKILQGGKIGVNYGNLKLGEKNIHVFKNIFKLDLKILHKCQLSFVRKNNSRPRCWNFSFRNFYLSQEIFPFPSQIDFNGDPCPLFNVSFLVRNMLHT